MQFGVCTPQMISSVTHNLRNIRSKSVLKKALNLFFTIFSSSGRGCKGGTMAAPSEPGMSGGLEEFRYKWTLNRSTSTPGSNEQKLVRWKMIFKGLRKKDYCIISAPLPDLWCSLTIQKIGMLADLAFSTAIATFSRIAFPPLTQSGLLESMKSCCKSIKSSAFIPIFVFV